jgi:hypothetical protein
LDDEARDRRGINMRIASIARLAALGIAGLAVAGPTSVAADTWLEVEHARANARAGGPISDSDAELLERYGCLSGTRNKFCQRLEHRGSDRRYRKVRRRR